MIKLIDNAFELDHDCTLVSCRFDAAAIKQGSLSEIESQWGVNLPEKLQHAVDKRKAEFIAGRYCAKRALAKLDDAKKAAEEQIANKFIGIGDKRQPLWPTGIAGSITHSHGFAAAAVARQSTVRTLGIDSEQLINPKTANNVASHILTEEESFADNRGIVASGDEYLTLVFSAKESIFKCLYPLVQRYFDFKDAVITFSPATPNRFSYRLRKSLSDEFHQGFTGEGIFQREQDFIHTAVLLKQ